MVGTQMVNSSPAARTSVLIEIDDQLGVNLHNLDQLNIRLFNTVDRLRGSAKTPVGSAKESESYPVDGLADFLNEKLNRFDSIISRIEANIIELEHYI